MAMSAKDKNMVMQLGIDVQEVAKELKYLGFVIEAMNQKSINASKQATTIMSQNMAALQLATQKSTALQIQAIQQIQQASTQATKTMTKTHEDSWFDSIKKSWKSFSTGANQAMELINKFKRAIEISFVEPLMEAARFETFRTNLKVLLGSTTEASNRFKEMVRFAAVTPFNVPQVVQAGQQLQAVGRYSLETLRMLGDLAAASGRSIEEAIEAYTNMVTGRTGIAVRQFRMMLISTQDWNREIGKQVLKTAGTASATVEEMISALPRILKSKNFLGLMEERVKTLEGRLSNLKDIWQQLLASFGETYIDQTKEWVVWLTNAITNFRLHLTGTIESIKVIIQTIGVFVLAIKSMAIMTAVINGMTAAVTSLSAAMVALSYVNPYLAAIGLLATGVSILYAFKVSNKQYLEDIQNQKEAEIASLEVQRKDLLAKRERGVALVALIDKYKKAKEGTEEYTEALSALSLQFGGQKNVLAMTPEGSGTTELIKSLVKMREGLTQDKDDQHNFIYLLKAINKESDSYVKKMEEAIDIDVKKANTTEELVAQGKAHKEVSHELSRALKGIDITMSDMDVTVLRSSASIQKQSADFAYLEEKIRGVNEALSEAKAGLAKKAMDKLDYDLNPWTHDIYNLGKMLPLVGMYNDAARRQAYFPLEERRRTAQGKMASAESLEEINKIKIEYLNLVGDKKDSLYLDNPKYLMEMTKQMDLYSNSLLGVLRQRKGMAASPLTAINDMMSKEQTTLGGMTEEYDNYLKQLDNLLILKDKSKDTGGILLKAKIDLNLLSEEDITALRNSVAAQMRNVENNLTEMASKEKAKRIKLSDTAIKEEMKTAELEKERELSRLERNYLTNSLKYKEGAADAEYKFQTQKNKLLRRQLDEKYAIDKKLLKDHELEMATLEYADGIKALNAENSIQEVKEKRRKEQANVEDSTIKETNKLKREFEKSDLVDQERWGKNSLAYKYYHAKNMEKLELDLAMVTEKIVLEREKSVLESMKNRGKAENARLDVINTRIEDLPSKYKDSTKGGESSSTLAEFIARIKEAKYKGSKALEISGEERKYEDETKSNNALKKEFIAKEIETLDEYKTQAKIVSDLERETADIREQTAIATDASQQKITEAQNKNAKLEKQIVDGQEKINRLRLLITANTSHDPSILNFFGRSNNASYADQITQEEQKNATLREQIKQNNILIDTESSNIASAIKNLTEKTNKYNDAKKKLDAMRQGDVADPAVKKKIEEAQKEFDKAESDRLIAHNLALIAIEEKYSKVLLDAKMTIIRNQSKALSLEERVVRDNEMTARDNAALTKGGEAAAEVTSYRTNLSSLKDKQELTTNIDDYHSYAIQIEALTIAHNAKMEELLGEQGLAGMLSNIFSDGTTESTKNWTAGIKATTMAVQYLSQGFDSMYNLQLQKGREAADAWKKDNDAKVEADKEAKYAEFDKRLERAKTEKQRQRIEAERTEYDKKMKAKEEADKQAYDDKVREQAKTWFELKKAASIAEITVNASVSASKIWKEFVGFPVIIGILEALLAGATAAQIAGVASQTSGYAQGGYTGDGGKFEPAGTVHKGEFVVDKERTKKYRPLLEAMQGTPLHGTQYATGGYVDHRMSSVVVTPDGMLAREVSELRKEIATMMKNPVAPNLIITNSESKKIVNNGAGAIRRGRQ